MHTYYNPALKIRDVGRLLHEDTFSGLTEKLGEGEVLFELMERPDHVHYAVLMDSKETFDEFQHISMTHPYTRLGYFAVITKWARRFRDQASSLWA